MLLEHEPGLETMLEFRGKYFHNSVRVISFFNTFFSCRDFNKFVMKEQV